MKKQIAVGFLPYEIGDKISLKNSRREYVITDIKMCQFIKDKKVEFEVQLNDKDWISADLIKERIIEPTNT